MTIRQIVGVVTAFSLGIVTATSIHPTRAENPSAQTNIEFTSGAHIWGRLDHPALHLRSPKAPTYSQINLYPDEIRMWGGTNPGGKSIALTQTALLSTQGNLDLGSNEDEFRNLHLQGTVMARSLRGAGRRYACIEPDGKVVASVDPCDR